MDRLKFKFVLFFTGGLALSLILASASLFAQPNGSPSFSAEKRDPPVRGLALADFDLKTLKGDNVSLWQWKGKPVLVNFWATWCNPCKEEMPLFEQLHKDHPGDVVILAIDASEDSGTVQDYIQKYAYSFIVLLDPEGQAQDQFLVRGYPSTYFIDANGVLQALHIGQLDEHLLSGYLNQIGVKQ